MSALINKETMTACEIILPLLKIFSLLEDEAFSPAVFFFAGNKSKMVFESIKYMHLRHHPTCICHVSNRPFFPFCLKPFAKLPKMGILKILPILKIFPFPYDCDAAYNSPYDCNYDFWFQLGFHAPFDSTLV